MFYVFPDAKTIGVYVANILSKRLAVKPNLVLGLATGSTMLPIYEAWRAQLQQEPIDLSAVTSFNLDEYIGLAPTHEQSYHFFMQDNLFKHLGLSAEQTHLPDGTKADMAKECRHYSEAIEQAGLDIQLLGIGTNGHIGFNEPYTTFNSRTHVIELSESTRQDNSRFFDNMDEVPTHAVTMGLADIMSAKEIILVATGAHKAEIMAQLFHSPVSEAMPASVLKQHGQVLILMDEQAASLLPKAAVSRL